MEQIALSYKEIKQEIRERAGQIVQNFVHIGCRLKEVEDKQMYLEDGYQDLNEFGKKEFGMDPTAVSRFIRVYEKFAEGGYNPKLKEEYRELSYSQLSEMLTIGEDDYELITKDTTVKQIRELKKFNKMEQEDISKEVQEQDLSELQKVIVEFFRLEENKEILDLIFKDAAEVSEEEIIESLNLGGTRTFRKGIYFLMFYESETGIKYKKMMDSNIYPMSYTEFFDQVITIFADYEKNGIVWENYYGALEKESEKVENATSQEDRQQRGIGEKKQKEEKPIRKEVEKTPVNEVVSIETERKQIEHEEVPQKEIEEEQIEGQMVVEDYPELLPNCEFCREGAPSYVFDMNKQTLEIYLSISLEREEVVIKTDKNKISIPINYCPQCGRKLASPQ